MTPPHSFGCRVYYEDTDLAGLVYYANYLKFIERGRTEMLREAGLDQTALRDGAGLVFAVTHLSAAYLSPARFDDWLSVQTRIARISGARVVLGQDVLRQGERLFAAEVTLACLTSGGRPARLPLALRNLAPGPA